MGVLDIFRVAPKAVDDILDKDNGLLSQVGGWINDQQLTDAEVMKANLKTVEDVQAFVQATLSESTSRSKARRAIAINWFKMVGGLIFLICMAAPWDANLSKFYFDLLTSNTIASVTTAITIFYFGSYGLSRHNETKKDK